MTEIEQTRELVIANLIWSSYPKLSKGGQTTNHLVRGVELHSPDMDFTIQTNSFRSQLKNKEVAYEVFKLALEEWLK